MVTTNDINYLEIANQLGWICKDIGNDQILFSHPLEKSGEYSFTANRKNISNSVYINKCVLESEPKPESSAKEKEMLELVDILHCGIELETGKHLRHALIEKAKELHWRVNTRSLDQYVLSTNTSAGNYGFSVNPENFISDIQLHLSSLNPSKHNLGYTGRNGNVPTTDTRSVLKYFDGIQEKLEELISELLKTEEQFFGE